MTLHFARYCVTLALFALVAGLIPCANLIASDIAGQKRGGDGGTPGKSLTTTGTVESVSGTSLTVKTNDGTKMTFVIDDKTNFIAKGLSTKSRAKSGKITATDAVGSGDAVTVTYRDTGSAMHASQVRMNNKAMATKK